MRVYLDERHLSLRQKTTCRLLLGLVIVALAALLLSAFVTVLRRNGKSKSVLKCSVVFIEGVHSFF